MKREAMKEKRKHLFVIYPLVVFLLVFALDFWAQVCNETTKTFTENFDTVTYKNEAECSVDNWCEAVVCGGYVTLGNAGILQQVPLEASISSWINRVAYANFDLDPGGLIDIIASSDQYYLDIAYVHNNGDGTFTEMSPKIWDEVTTDSKQNCLLAGDYDDDGDPDFMYVLSTVDAPSSPGAIQEVWFFEHEGWVDGNGVPQFTRYDYTSKLAGDLEGIGWNVTNQALDFDGDSDIDILFANGYGKVILLRNRSNRALSNNTKFEASTLIDATVGESGNRWQERGVIAIGAGDIDNDNDIDLILGAVNWRGLKVYINDGSENFTFKENLGDMSGSDLNDDLYDGACSALAMADYDRDGDLDFIVGTDNWNRQEAYPPVYEDTGMGAKVYYFDNDGTGTFTSTLIYNREAPWDFDFGLPMDYDGDGDFDFMVADGNHSEFYYIFKNIISDRYNLSGKAVSTNVTTAAFPGGLDSTQNAITRVRFTDIDQSVLGSSDGLLVKYYVSNNGGRNWEYYTEYSENDIHNVTEPLPWHTFTTFGADLRWKAELEAPDDYPDELDVYHGTSNDTPRIDLISMEYVYVERMEYSRTSVAVRVVDDAGTDRELIIGGTFYFPGWQGHLRAYDVSAMTPAPTDYSELRTITRPDILDPTGREIVAAGVTLLWDAGEELNARAPADRLIYTALPDGSGGFNRIEFTAANVGLMVDGDGDSLLQDYDADDIGLINYVRGEGRDWKLGDINHSNPIIEERAGTKVLIVGANDGMIHCFDVLTGEELWAFIPYSLLPRLKYMWAIDSVTGERYYSRQSYVDGSPMSADVQISGVDKTVVICGLGPGQGSTADGTGNFYFAMDITDINNPLPMWEFIHEKMGETWSVPVVGKVNKGGDTWVAFMGSGYDNTPLDGIQQGNRFFAVTVADGVAFWGFEAANVDTSGKWPNAADILCAFPGSPNSVDEDRDEYTDKVYIGDLEGRMWRIDVTTPWADAASWTATAIYTDDNNFPIITKPEVWLDPGNPTAKPRIYFGTGGDDEAPDDVDYAFIAMIDDTTPEVEWFLGRTPTVSIPANKKVGDLDTGDKVWADPKIANSVVYFSTLTYDIESVDPCQNLTGTGKLYGRYVNPASGNPLGSSAFTMATGTVESLDLDIKTRAAVTIGETSTVESTGVRKQDVYIQEYNSTIQKLEQPIGAAVIVRSWREIRRIKK